MRYWRTLFSLLILFTVNSTAQDLTAKLPVDPNVITGTLPNGLTYYVRHNSTPAQNVELRLVVKAGSILEDDDQQGLAHFVEHMNFNGTANFKKNELVSYLQTIGVKFGADLNASTSFDNTTYRLSIPTGHPDYVEKGFQVLEDCAHNALLTDADIDDERGVVLEESRLRKGAAQRMMDQYFPEMVAGSRYANRMPIGKDSILKNCPYESLRRFYKDWYRPDLQAVTVVGDIDTATAITMIRKHFASLTNPPAERPHFYSQIPPLSKPEGLVVKDKETDQGAVAIVYPYLKKHKIETAGDLINSFKKELVLAMVNQRFADMFHNTGADANYVSFYHQAHDYEAFAASCSYSQEGGPGWGIHYLTRELVRIRDHGFLQSELDVAEKKVLREMDGELAGANKATNISFTEEYVSNFTDNEDIAAAATYFGYYNQMLPGIQLTELDSIARSWIRSPNIFVLAAMTDKAGAWYPSNATLLKIAQDGFYQFTDQAKIKVVDTVLVDDKPTPGKVTGKTYDPELAATTYTLANGIKVTIKKTNFKDNEIVLAGIKKGGKSNYDSGDKSNIIFMEPITEAMGFGSFKSYDIYKATADRNIKVTTSMKEVTNVVSGSCGQKDFEFLMQLVYLRLTQPRKDVKVFREVVKKKGNKLDMDNLYDDPERYFEDTLAKVLYDNNPLAKTLPHYSDLEDLDLKSILSIYKNEFSYADGYHFFIVGNLDTVNAIPLIETYLGSLVVSGTAPRYTDNVPRPVNGIHQIIVRKGKEQKSKIERKYYGPLPYSEELNLKAEMLVDILNIKITEHLREKMGKIYTGGFKASVHHRPYEHYEIDLSIPCGPENVDKLIGAASDEIKAVKENGPTAADLEKVKNNLLENRRKKLRENHFWVTELESLFFWNSHKERFLDYESRVIKITVSDIQSAANLLFDGKNEFTAILMPE